MKEVNITLNIDDHSIWDVWQDENVRHSDGARTRRRVAWQSGEGVQEIGLAFMVEEITDWNLFVKTGKSDVDNISSLK